MQDSPTASSTMRIPYGCEAFGRLTHVMLHRPGESLRLINESNRHRWLFDAVPDVDRYGEEHDRYRQLLTDHKVTVLELADYVNHEHHRIAAMPNLTFLHDTAVITRRGAILSCMAMDGRRHEHRVVREALGNLGVPIFIDFDETHDAFEGCLLLSPRTVLVAETERHNVRAIRRFIRKALTVFEEVVYVDVPKARRYMHPDTIFNRITDRLALVYMPAFVRTVLHRRDRSEPIDFVRWMRGRGVELIHVSDLEQRRLACTFVPLEPGVMFHYDTALARETQIALARRGVELILFHPEAILAGGGSLRCHTLRLRRAASGSAD
ncbi:MAG: arginine deiminase [Phycisphaerae bacterium]|nr:arginine deiminase [Phycisphaerae bacterium]